MPAEDLIGANLMIQCCGDDELKQTVPKKMMVRVARVVVVVFGCGGGCGGDGGGSGDGGGQGDVGGGWPVGGDFGYYIGLVEDEQCSNSVSRVLSILVELA